MYGIFSHMWGIFVVNVGKYIVEHILYIEHLGNENTMADLNCKCLKTETSIMGVSEHGVYNSTVYSILQWLQIISGNK